MNETTNATLKAEAFRTFGSHLEASITFTDVTEQKVEEFLECWDNEYAPTLEDFIEFHKHTVADTLLNRIGVFYLKNLETIVNLVELS